MPQMRHIAMKSAHPRRLTATWSEDRFDSLQAESRVRAPGKSNEALEVATQAQISRVFAGPSLTLGDDHPLRETTSDDLCA